MLNHVSISKPEFEIGELAEALVYYGKVDLNVGSGHFPAIVRAIGIDNTIRLAESQYFNFVYTADIPAVWSRSDQFFAHRFTAVNLSKTAEGLRLKSPDIQIKSSLSRGIGKGAVPWSKIQRLSRALLIKRDDGKAIMDAALSDIHDKYLLSTMIRAALSALIPAYPYINISVAQAQIQGDDFDFESNIDFASINAFYRATNPDDTMVITPAILLSFIANMRWELYRSGDLGCDVWTSPVQSAVMRAKVDSFVERLSRGQKAIARFEEHELAGRSFRRACETKAIDFSEIMDFIEAPKTQKFKRWIAESKVNGELLREYDRANATDSALMKSLPIKLARFVTFSGLGAVLGNALGGAGLIGGLAGTAADFVVGKAEEALAEKIKLGWKPNQWVSTAARPLLFQSEGGTKG